MEYYRYLFIITTLSPLEKNYHNEFIPNTNLFHKKYNNLNKSSSKSEYQSYNLILHSKNKELEE